MNSTWNQYADGEEMRTRTNNPVKPHIPKEKKRKGLIHGIDKNNSDAFEPYRPPNTPVDRIFSERNLRNVLANLLLNASLVTTEVKGGEKGPGKISVNSDHKGKRVTLIIWDK